MKVSEAIEKLQKSVEDHGDCDFKIVVHSNQVWREGEPDMLLWDTTGTMSFIAKEEK